MKLYDGATVKLRNGEIGKCSSNGGTTFPFTIIAGTNRSTATERGTYFVENYAHQRDVVEILDEFQNGELVEIGYENSDVWNQRRYAAEINGAHYYYSNLKGCNTLHLAEKIRKIPRRGWQWLFRTADGMYGLTVARYPDEETAKNAVSTDGHVVKVEITEGPLGERANMEELAGALKRFEQEQPIPSR